MKEAPQTSTTGEPEETLVTPRFDEVETVQAQPVVPLAEVPPGADGDRSFGTRRASWPLALVLVSALVGVVVGGAGLYFYQHRSSEAAAGETQPAPAPATAEAPTVDPAAAEVSSSLPPQQAEPDAEADAAEVVSAETVEPNAGGAKKEEAEKAPAPEPRGAAERDDDAGALKRVRKAEQEAEVVRRTPRAERVGSREAARGDDDDDEPKARLADEIIYRPRRAERRAERRERRENRQRSVDRVRGIFEGQPE
jgi:hypothetical protein